MVGRPFQDQATKKSAASVLTDPFLLSEGSQLPCGELLYEKAHGSENGGQLLTGSGEEPNLTDNLVSELGWAPVYCLVRIQPRPTPLTAGFMRSIETGTQLCCAQPGS